MKVLLSLFLLSPLCLSAPMSYLYADLSGVPENEKRCEEEIFQNLKEAEEYLKSHLKQKEILTGDFWGINITAYRYSHAFYPRGYIAYKINKIDAEIKKIRQQIDRLKNQKSADAAPK